MLRKQIYSHDLNYQVRERVHASAAVSSWRGPLKLEGVPGAAGGGSAVPPGGEEQRGGRRRTRVEVGARDDFGFTALHYAAQSGLAKCIEYLLAHGANAFAETREGTRRTDERPDETAMTLHPM